MDDTCYTIFFTFDTGSTRYHTLFAHAKRTAAGCGPFTRFGVCARHHCYTRLYRFGWTYLRCCAFPAVALTFSGLLALRADLPLARIVPFGVGQFDVPVPEYRHSLTCRTVALTTVLYAVRIPYATLRLTRFYS